MLKFKQWLNKERSILIIGIALIQGLVFIFLVPPWQHYDEPGNFEYAWLVANLDHWPKIGEYSVEMRREVAASMMEHDFYKGLSYSPDLIAIDPPPDIGISQLGDLPLYFFLTSLPLRIFKFTDITFQLYIDRFVSLILFLITIWAAIGICNELFGANHPLTWMIPLFLVFLTPFTSLMTAVNNDVAAIAFSTIFLWVCIKIIYRGFHLWNTVWFIIMLAACILSKSTTLVVLPLFFLIIGIGIYRLVKKRIIIYALGFISVILISLLFSWNKTAPSLFYARQDSLIPLRIKSKIAPVGKNVFTLATQKSDEGGYFQMLSSAKIKQLLGNQVTLGVWMWADEPLDIRSPDLIINNQGIFPDNYIHLETKPNFFVLTGQIPRNSDLGWLMVYPGMSREKTSVYWDGWILAVGDFTSSPSPIFQDSQASSAIWNKSTVTNILSNGSGEKSWPILRSPINNFLNSYFHFSSAYLWSFLDFSGTGWYFRSAISWLFKTFWVKFGWAHVTLRGSRFFWIFSVLSVAGLLGSILASWKHKNRLPWILVAFLIIDLFGTFWITLLRGMGSWSSHLILPAARYAYPAIIPVAIILCGGWYYLADHFIHRFAISKNIGFIFFLAGLGLYDILSLYTILTFYWS